MKKKNKKVNIFLKILLVLLIIVAIFLGFGYWYINQKINKIQIVDIDETELEISEDENLDEYRNIAIFGVDSRSDDYGTGNRSDCIIIASINNKTGDVKLISVYRDTYVNIEGYGLDKITHAYSYGETPLAIKTLNTNLDLNIKEFVTVNFDSVSDIVDAVGGVELTITADEIKYINGYINETSKVTGKRSQHITTPGTYNVDGVQAVSYSRIRYTEGGDYKRAERMRTVIAAVLKKLKTKNIGELNSITDKILPHIYTNISSKEILSLIPNVLKYNIGESIGWPYVTRGITLNRWYGIPITLESNVVRLHQEVFGEPDYQASEKIKTISQKIVLKTGYSY